MENDDAAFAAGDKPVLFWDDRIAPADTPVIFTDENFQQLLAMDNLVDIAMSALDNDDLLPALPNPEPSATVPLTDRDFERYFNMNSARCAAVPAAAPLSGMFVAVPARIAEAITPRAKKSLDVNAQVSEVADGNLAAYALDLGTTRRKVSSSQAGRRRVSAHSNRTGKAAAAAASSAPRPARKRGKGKVATFTLTGKTVERVFNGTTLTSHHCSDGVIRILAEDALEEAKARTAAAKKKNGAAVEQLSTTLSKNKRKTPPVASEKQSKKRSKAAHSADAEG